MQTLTPRIDQFRELTSATDMAAAIDIIMSEANSLAVAVNKAGIGGDAMQPGTISQKLLAAFGDLYDARRMLRAIEPEPAQQAA